MKSKIYVVVMSLFMLSLAAPTFAEVSATNDTTGYASTNYATANIDNNVDISVKNDTDIANNLCFVLNTGYNSASYNTGDGTVSSGDIAVDPVITNNVEPMGAIMTNVIGGMGGGDITASNSVTGANSNNEANAKIENRYDLDVRNDTDIDNKVSIHADTGHNAADYNTGDGSVTSGDITIGVNITNDVGGIGGGDDDEDDEDDDNNGGGGGGTVTPQGGTGGGVLNGVLGMGGGAFDFPDALPRAGTSLALLAAMALMTGLGALGAKKFSLARKTI